MRFPRLRRRPTAWPCPRRRRRPRRRGAGLIVLAIVVIVAVIAAAALTQAPLRARLARLLDAGAATQDAALAKRVDRLAADVAALQAALKNVPDAARIAALEKRVDDMAKAPAPAAGADPRRVAALETRLKDLAAKVEGLASKAQAQAGDRSMPLMLALTGALDRVARWRRSRPPCATGWRRSVRPVPPRAAISTRSRRSSIRACRPRPCWRRVPGCWS